MNDVTMMMRYDAAKKSSLIAYLLWFFLGYFGAHRFYLGAWGTGLFMLLLGCAGWVLAFVLIGYLLLTPVALWWLIDLFLIPGMVRRCNERLIRRLQNGTY